MANEKELLDKLADARISLEGLEKEANENDIWTEFQFIYSKKLLIASGIERLAKAAEVPLKSKPYEDERYHFRASFEYKGIEFFELLKEAPHEDNE